jgi:hypothetical protein
MTFARLTSEREARKKLMAEAKDSQSKPQLFQVHRYAGRWLANFSRTAIKNERASLSPCN